MKASDVDRLRMSVNAINLGDDLQHVIKTVGVPDSDFTVKKNWTTRFLTYYVTRERSDSPVETDKQVTIALNEYNRVKAIYSNLQNIPSRNWPGVTSLGNKRAPKVRPSFPSTYPS
jgi:hypothetical protein